MKDASHRDSEYARCARTILTSYAHVDNVSFLGNLAATSVLPYGNMVVATSCRLMVRHAHGDVLCYNQDYARKFIVILSELEEGSSMQG